MVAEVSFFATEPSLGVLIRFSFTFTSRMTIRMCPNTHCPNLGGQLVLGNVSEANHFFVLPVHGVYKTRLGTKRDIFNFGML